MTKLNERRGLARLEGVTWPDGLQVGALPGVVGQPDQAFPSSTTNALKVLRARGVTAQRLSPAPEIKLMANEIWLPFLIVATQVLAGVAGHLIAEGIIGLIKADDQDGSQTLVHAKFGKLRADGVSLDWIELEGRAAEVAPAARAFFSE